MARTSSRATEGPTSKRVSSRWLDGFMDLFRASTRSRESAKQAELVASTELRRAGSSPNAVDVDRRRRSSQRREAVNVVAIEVDLLTDEEKRRKQMRLFVVSLRWQIFLLLTAFVDIALMIVEIANPDAAMAVVIVTIFVLVIFAIDLMLRWYAYRLLNLRSAWFWFDLLIVSASVILSIVTAASADLLAAERGDVGTSAEVATATTTSTRGARAIRGVVMTGARCARCASPESWCSSRRQAGRACVTSPGKTSSGMSIWRRASTSMSRTSYPACPRRRRQ